MKHSARVNQSVFWAALSGDYQSALTDYEALKAMGSKDANTKIIECRRKLNNRQASANLLDYYGVLGLTSNCTPAEIKHAYR